jgi:hypothetical protein
MACLTPKRIFILKTNSLSQASVSEKDLASLSTPEHITLLLKNHKQTVLLSVIPTTPFNEIKSLLLAVLKSRNITSLDGIPISDEAEDIEFGVLRNKKNPVEGWVPLNIKEMEVGDAKGNKSPAGASLVDGSMLAFRFRTESKRDAPEDEDDEMEIEDDPGWNVILPSYDDEE